METDTRRVLRRWKIAPVVVASVAVLSACSSSSNSQAPSALSSAVASQSTPVVSTSAESSSPTASSAPSVPTAAPTITIKDFKYTTPLSVAPGAMVTVMNADSQGHTVTGDTASAFDAKVGPGASASFTAPSAPGTYPFHCTYHGNMHGVLIVK